MLQVQLAPPAQQGRLAPLAQRELLEQPVSVSQGRPAPLVLLAQPVQLVQPGPQVLLVPREKAAQLPLSG